MGQQGVVTRQQLFPRGQGQARSVNGVAVTMIDVHLRFVEGHPMGPPNRLATTSVYSANQSALSWFSQPPFWKTLEGKSQWYSVTHGDVVREQGVDQSIVEREPFSLTAPVPSGRIRGQANDKR